MEVGGELIMGFSESQEMNPRREMDERQGTSMKERAAGQTSEPDTYGVFAALALLCSRRPATCSVVFTSEPDERLCQIAAS
ncbi:hypothetical protein EYF80_052737 [Liparis tanakae]|uniref:Uncharacterized protein n=1 Tax=Liparis tanakae TaxID=230148 RepID=A0A4Z2F770_9TELE|nr:hypothetical protein EYF80_052737 [Liparis tanakae]